MFSPNFSTAGSKCGSPVLAGNALFGLFRFVRSGSAWFSDCRSGSGPSGRAGERFGWVVVERAGPGLARNRALCHSEGFFLEGFCGVTVFLRGFAPGAFGNLQVCLARSELI